MKVDFYLDDLLVHTIDISGVPHSDQNIWLTSIAANLHKTDHVDDSALPEVARSLRANCWANFSPAKLYLGPTLRQIR